jgi:hypothetical protein
MRTGFANEEGRNPAQDHFNSRQINYSLRASVNQESVAAIRFIHVDSNNGTSKIYAGGTLNFDLLRQMHSLPDLNLWKTRFLLSDLVCRGFAEIHIENYVA